MASNDEPLASEAVGAAATASTHDIMPAPTASDAAVVTHHRDASQVHQLLRAAKQLAAKYETEAKETRERNIDLTRQVHVAYMTYTAALTPRTHSTVVCTPAGCCADAVAGQGGSSRSRFLQRC